MYMSLSCFKLLRAFPYLYTHINKKQPVPPCLEPKLLFFSVLLA